MKKLVILILCLFAIHLSSKADDHGESRLKLGGADVVLKYKVYSPPIFVDSSGAPNRGELPDWFSVYISVLSVSGSSYEEWTKNMTPEFIQEGDVSQSDFDNSKDVVGIDPETIIYQVEVVRDNVSYMIVATVDGAATGIPDDRNTIQYELYKNVDGSWLRHGLAAEKWLSFIPYSDISRIKELGTASELMLDSTSRLIPGANWQIAELSSTGCVVQPIAINDQGVVIGNCWERGASKAFVWQSGSMSQLEPSQAPNAQSVTLAMSGSTTVGFSNADLSSPAVARCWRNGSIVLVGGTDANVSYSCAVNGSDYVAGSLCKGGSSAEPRTPFLWVNGEVRVLSEVTGVPVGINSGGTVIGWLKQNGSVCGFKSDVEFQKTSNLESLGGALSYPVAINDSGVIAGYSATLSGECHGCLWNASQSGAQDLGTLGGVYSEARALNSNGEIVGLSSDPDSHIQAVLWRFGNISSLGTLGGEYSEAIANNSSGTVIGYSSRKDGTIVPFLYRGRFMNDLTKLVPSGWVVTSVIGLNENNELIGTGIHNGMQAGFVLSPITSGANE